MKRNTHRRYSADNFWSPRASDEGRVCALAFETFTAHLVKARTWALDELGSPLPPAGLPRADRLEQKLPSELGERELAEYVFFWGGEVPFLFGALLVVWSWSWSMWARPVL